MAKQKSKKKKKRRAVRVLLILLCLLLLLAAMVCMYVNNLLDNLSFASRDGSSILHEIVQPWSTPILSNDVTQIQSGNRAEGHAISSRNVVNILLIGSDYRIPGTSDPGRADVTMLCSLNKKTGSIKLVSFERGIMVDVPGVGTDLLTHSFHWGGAELTTDIIRSYFLLDIVGYAHVDFESFSQLVDAVGGVDIELTDSEAWALGLNTGWNHLNGADALRYCRLRSIDSNWQRIARQRNTVQAIMNQVKDMSLTELNSLAEEVLPLIHTDLSKGEITSLLMSAPKFLGVTAEQMAVPDHNDQNCDFQYESERLNNFLYGK